MLADLASQLTIDQIHSQLIHSCYQQPCQQRMIAQRSSINNWEHTYVGWMIVS
jgi:hypothetical protein